MGGLGTWAWVGRYSHYWTVIVAAGGVVRGRGSVGDHCSGIMADGLLGRVACGACSLVRALVLLCYGACSS